LRTREFWALFAAQICIPLGIFPVSVHQVAYVTDLGFRKAVAAAILGHMGLMSSCGRIMFGALSDRLGRFGGCDKPYCLLAARYRGAPTHPQCQPGLAAL
jgi:MFS family permease